MQRHHILVHKLSDFFPVVYTYVNALKNANILYRTFRNFKPRP